MYEGSETMVRCAVGTTESFKVKVGLHQGSALSPYRYKSAKSKEILVFGINGARKWWL